MNELSKLSFDELLKQTTLQQIMFTVSNALSYGVTIEQIKQTLETVCPVDKDGAKIDWGRKIEQRR